MQKFSHLLLRKFLLDQRSELSNLIHKDLEVLDGYLKLESKSLTYQCIVES
jgi:hypothetical protein